MHVNLYNCCIIIYNRKTSELTIKLTGAKDVDISLKTPNPELTKFTLTLILLTKALFQNN